MLDKSGVAKERRIPDDSRTAFVGDVSPMARVSVHEKTTKTNPFMFFIILSVSTVMEIDGPRNRGGGSIGSCNRVSIGDFLAWILIEHFSFQMRDSSKPIASFNPQLANER
jgi:hypothetical protein